jgi:uncharacterized MAPEG superfamily protein
MGDTLKKYAIPILIGVVVLYVVMRYARGGGSTSTTSTINRLVPLQGEQNTAQVARDQARVSAFSNLAGVAGQQIAAEAQAGQLSYGEKVENIKAGLQRELGLQGLEGLKLQIAGQEEVYRINSADRRYDTDAQLLASQRMATAQENMFSTQADLAFRTLMAQIGAVQSTAREYRGQSLERAGTYLNALSAIWNQPRVYDYQTSFGGPRGPSILQQITGLLQGAGSFINPFF